MKKYLLLLLLFSFNFCWGQVRFQKTYKGHTGNNFGRDIIQCSDGGFLMNGEDDSNHDIFLIKTNSIGDTLWVKYFNNTFDYGIGIQQTSDAGYIVCGNTDTASYQCIFLMKLDSIGNKIWAKRLGYVF